MSVMQVSEILDRLFGYDGDVDAKLQILDRLRDSVDVLKAAILDPSTRTRMEEYTYQEEVRTKIVDVPEYFHVKSDASTSHLYQDTIVGYTKEEVPVYESRQGTREVTFFPIRERARELLARLST